MIYTKEQLDDILSEHKKWLFGEGGKRANLSEAKLSRADLSEANLSWADLSGANLSGADLSEANLSGADLSRADLSEANLSRADLSGANLSEAYLSGYSESHNVFQYAINQQDVKTFTEKEWSMIGVIIIKRICWGTIKKRYGKSAMTIFKKLSKCGYNEWEKRYKEILQ